MSFQNITETLRPEHNRFHEAHTFLVAHTLLTSSIEAVSPKAIQNLPSPPLTQTINNLNAQTAQFGLRGSFEFVRYDEEQDALITLTPDSEFSIDKGYGALLAFQDGDTLLPVGGVKGIRPDKRTWRTREESDIATISDLTFNNLIPGVGSTREELLAFRQHLDQVSQIRVFDGDEDLQARYSENIAKLHANLTRATTSQFDEVTTGFELELFDNSSTTNERTAYRSAVDQRFAESYGKTASDEYWLGQIEFPSKVIESVYDIKGHLQGLLRIITETAHESGTYLTLTELCSRFPGLADNPYLQNIALFNKWGNDSIKDKSHLGAEFLYRFRPLVDKTKPDDEHPAIIYPANALHIHTDTFSGVESLISKVSEITLHSPSNIAAIAVTGNGRLFEGYCSDKNERAATINHILLTGGFHEAPHALSSEQGLKNTAKALQEGLANTLERAASYAPDIDGNPKPNAHPLTGRIRYSQYSTLEYTGANMHPDIDLTAAVVLDRAVDSFVVKQYVLDGRTNQLPQEIYGRLEPREMHDLVQELSTDNGARHQLADFYQAKLEFLLEALPEAYHPLLLENYSALIKAALPVPDEQTLIGWFGYEDNAEVRQILRTGDNLERLSQYKVENLRGVGNLGEVISREWVRLGGQILPSSPSYSGGLEKRPDLQEQIDKMIFNWVRATIAQAQ